jgi:hypothetical protein
VSSAVFIAQEVDGVEDKGSGDTTKVDVQTHLEALSNMSLISVSLQKLFSGKKQDSQSCDSSPLAPDNDFQVSNVGLKEFCRK